MYCDKVIICQTRILTMLSAQLYTEGAETDQPRHPKACFSPTHVRNTRSSRNC